MKDHGKENTDIDYISEHIVKLMNIGFCPKNEYINVNIHLVREFLKYKGFTIVDYDGCFDESLEGLVESRKAHAKAEELLIEYIEEYYEYRHI